MRSEFVMQFTNIEAVSIDAYDHTASIGTISARGLEEAPGHVRMRSS